MYWHNPDDHFNASRKENVLCQYFISSKGKGIPASRWRRRRLFLEMVYWQTLTFWVDIWISRPVLEEGGFKHWLVTSWSMLRVHNLSGSTYVPKGLLRPWLSSPAQKKLVDMCAVRPSRESRILSLSLRAPVVTFIAFPRKSCRYDFHEIFEPFPFHHMCLVQNGTVVHPLIFVDPISNSMDVRYAWCLPPYPTLAPALWWPHSVFHETSVLKVLYLCTR